MALLSVLVTWLLLKAFRKLSSSYTMVPSLTPMTYRLATIGIP